MKNKSSLLILALLVLSGCMHVISENARNTVTPDLTFSDVKNNPQAHLGETLLLGGLILGITIDENGSTLEILRYDLDRFGEPYSVAADAGRFLAHTDRFLDPAIFGRGRLVTLAGTVKGTETHPLEPSEYVKIDYVYPTFRMTEIYLWDTPFRYGIYPYSDIYTPYYIGPEKRPRLNLYDPGYYYYPYTPYWLRPYGH